MTGVTVMTVAPVLIDAIYETSGTVKARATAVLASRIPGTVTGTFVKEGDRVRAGQVLLALDDRDASERLNAAQSAYNEALKAREAAEKQSGLADITYKRYGNLYKEKVVSGQEFDQVETQRNIAGLELERASFGAGRARALLEEARVQHGFTRIAAPFGGLVTARKVDQGAMAMPGIPLIVVEDTSGFKIDAFVDERLSGKVERGTPVTIRIDTTGESHQALITRVVHAVDPATRTFAIEIELKGNSFKSGLYGKVLVPEGKREAVIVPQSAVVEKGRLTGVYAVDPQGVVNYRLARTGRPAGNGVEVLSGLRKGDRIIVGGVERAVDGGIMKDRAGVAEAR